MKTRIFTLIMSLFVATMAFAYDAEIDGIYYNLDETNKIAEVTYQYEWNSDNYLGVTSIIIPEKVTYNGVKYSVTSIGERAFYYCSSLTSITIPNSVTSIGGSAFYSCSSLTSITIPNSVTSIGRSTFSSCSSLTSITISNSITSIGGSAFYSCSSLTSITIPNSVTSIGDYAFASCSSLTSITIPNSVTSIGESAFYGCSSLTSINIPNSVTSIVPCEAGEYFPGCSNLISINVEEDNKIYASVDGVLYDKNITTLMCCPQGKTLVTIPNSVTEIGDHAFSDCSFLTSITIQVENPLIIDEYTFKNVSRSVSIKVPCGSKVKYQTAEYWREFVNYEEVTAGTLMVAVNDKTMGFATVTKPNSCTDDVAQVQAQALAGYEFVRWSDGATENPHILLVTEDMTITAEFRKIGEEPEDKPGEDEKHNNFIVESADKTQGAVEITITAKAIEGFEFDHWSDGSTENPRVVTLDEDVELYAYFRVAGTGLENSVISSASVYGSNGVLYVEGAETDYYVLDAAGRLIYTGRDVMLQLPRGVYVIAVGGEVQKVVI